MAKTFKSFVYDVKAIFNPEIINGMCHGKFRLSPEYNNEGAPFGFDWIRTGDAKDYVAFDKPYQQHVGRYYENEEIISEEKVIEFSQMKFRPDKELYKKLCNSYPISNISVYPSPSGSRTPYHVPVLSIYPYTGNERDIAKLVLELNIIKSPARIELIYNTAHFEIKTTKNMPTGEGKHNIKLSVKCIQEFAEDQYIRVVSFNSKGKRKNAGIIRVCKNKKQLRRELNVLLVNTKILTSDDEEAIPQVGNAQKAIVGITCFLRHALMNPVFDMIDLDLGLNDELLRRMRIKRGKPVIIIQKYERENENVKTVEDTDTTLQFLIKDLSPIKDIENYDTIVFCFGIDLGFIYNDNIRYVAGTTCEKSVLLKKDYMAITACHETLHSIGLAHTFANMAYNEKTFSEYTYEKYETDNVMDYQKGEFNRTNLWEWQWKRIRAKGVPER